MQTFQSPEENRIGEGPHSLGVARLDSEVVDGVQVEVHDLVGEAVAADGLHNPVIDRSVLVQSIEEDVSWTNTVSQLVLQSNFNAPLLRKTDKIPISWKSGLAF